MKNIPRWKILLSVFGAIFIVLLFVSRINSVESKTTTPAAPPTQVAPKPKTAEEILRDKQAQAAAAGAAIIRKSAKDPESFDLKSVYLAPSGATCYEYRAKNSFGATMPSQAILVDGATENRKLYAKELDGSKFVNSWNKHCTKDGGEDITDPVKRAIRKLS